MKFVRSLGITRWGLAFIVIVAALFVYMVVTNLPKPPGKVVDEVIETEGWTVLVRTSKSSSLVPPSTTYNVALSDGWPLVSIDEKPVFRLTGLERFEVEELNPDHYNLQFSPRPGDQKGYTSRAEMRKAPLLGVGAIFFKEYNGDSPVLTFFIYPPGEWKNEFRNLE